MLPEGGLKALQNKAKNFRIGPFFDPPGPLELFSELFWTSKKGEPPHSVFFAGSHNCHKRPATEARKARLAGLAQIFLKTESTKIGHFSNEKCIVLRAFFKIWKLHGTHQLWFLKLQMTKKFNFLLLPVSAGSSPQNRGFQPHFLGENWKNHF